MLDRKIIITSDGSTSIHIPDWDEQYHSKHGAIQEAYHVFIKNGLEFFNKKNISILEIGLGTGLNCFITFLEAQKKSLNIRYTGVEAFPITDEEQQQLNYVLQLDADKYTEIFDLIHRIPWGVKSHLSINFELDKKLQKFQEIKDNNQHDLIYFDAFGPRVQPELWTESIFEKMFKALKKEGVLVTYSAKGSVRRALQKVGFKVEKLPGPPGKREMLRGVKN
jgi:tRNA U34 5-methylaminomethyl-2-thiouridine-forming methyltransferase MnmC